MSRKFKIILGIVGLVALSTYFSICQAQQLAATTVTFLDFAQEEDGYWLFEPASPRPDSAPVVIFIHGYSAYNPEVYGPWLEHLVKSGNTVIFPRYQEHIAASSESFLGNTVTAIRDAWQKLQAAGFVRPAGGELCPKGETLRYRSGRPSRAKEYGKMAGRYQYKTIGSGSSLTTLR